MVSVQPRVTGLGATAGLSCATITDRFDRTQTRRSRNAGKCKLDPANVLDHATSEIAVGSKLGIDATKKIPPGRR